ncbi:Hypothetical predicted protein [Cloeon dipterum]|uniref:Integrin alpha FG-GAP repeat containing 2 n=1 Tax=Cloeon dipterum TaxID=197152 RepID=A0A8S1C0X4_9INSE|nr:Hypothetical predicted protein [Cloeon dipterum]
MQGPVLKNALTFGDVDGDGEVELVVGNESGELCIFKDSSNPSKPWYQTTGLKMISAIGVGKLIEEAKNTLVVVSGDGWCHLLLPGAAPSCPPDVALGCDNNMHVAHIQCIPPNTHCLFLGDIDGDGQIELVVGLTDRVIRSYRWQRDPASTVPGEGKLVSLNKWEAASQVSSVSLGREIGGQPSILVSQPGGTLLKIMCTTNQYAALDNSLDEAVSTSKINQCTLSSNRSNKSVSVSTEIVGMIQTAKSTGDKGSPYAVAVTDGNLLLAQDDNILWSMQLNKQLFCITKLDITGDGNDEIVVCSWDGQTYVLGQDSISVRFQFEESVAAFTAGLFGKNSRPCFAYSTFNEKLVLFPNIEIQHLQARTVGHFMCTKFPNLSKEERRLLVQKSLYGVKK